MMSLIKRSRLSRREGSGDPKLLGASLALGMTRGEALSDEESHCHPEQCSFMEPSPCARLDPTVQWLLTPEKQLVTSETNSLYIVHE